jgi:hypothetical protein
MPHPERGELPGNSVNMAANLSSVSEDNELLVSERFFKNIQHELVLKSCGCSGGNYTCNGLRTVQRGLANSDTFRPTIIANKKASGLRLIENGPTFDCKRLANSTPD